MNSLSSLLGLARQVYRSDLLFVWGARISMGRVLWLARFLRKKNIVMYWCGSDVLGAQIQHAEGKLSPWIAKKIHWAGAPWLAEEVQALGLPCEYVPITWVPVQNEIHPLPANFSVLTYMPSVRLGKLYGLDRILNVARSLPHIAFRLMGLVEGQITDAPANLEILGRIPTDKMPGLYREAVVYWRPVSHDGLSFMSLEALSHGRYVIWSYPFPHCAHTKDAEADTAELERLHALHRANRLPLNQAGFDFVSKRFSAKSVKENFLLRWKEIILSPSGLSAGIKEPRMHEIQP